MAKNVTLQESGFYWYGHVDFDSATVDTSTENYNGYFSVLNNNDHFVGRFSFDDENYSIYPLGKQKHIITKDLPGTGGVACDTDGEGSTDFSDFYVEEFGALRNSFSCPVTVLALYTDRAMQRMGDRQWLRILFVWPFKIQIVP